MKVVKIVSSLNEQRTETKSYCYENACNLEIHQLARSFFLLE